MNTNPISLQDPAWCRALDLAERLTTLRATPGTGQRPPADPEAARLRLQGWQEQPPFAGTDLFAERLSAGQVTEEEFLHLLGEPIEAVQARLPQALGWLTRLAAALNQPAETADGLAPDTGPPAEPRAAPFLRLIEPLVRQASRRLEAGVAALARGPARGPFEPQGVTGLLLANLPGHVLGKLTRTLALEVNVARLRGELHGDDPRARFDHFVQRFEQTGGLARLLAEYPVLARQLIVGLDNWVDAGLEFLGRLCADWGRLRATFAPGQDPGPLSAVGDAGDGHQGGRSVCVLAFASGLRLIYRPRSMAVDVHFQELLAWLNERGCSAPFRTLRVMDQGDYGWSEFVQAAGCATPQEVERFYRRQGGTLALLYALEATDFHSENLIAAGEHPVLVDLEALFHPRVAGDSAERPDDPALHTIGHSVLRVGLLPERIDASDRVAGVDISALGGQAGQLSPQPVALWEGFATDEMRVVHRHAELAGSQNRPTLGGADVDALPYLDELLAGFREVYGLLHAHRAALIAGPLRRFRDDEVRVLLRSTSAYDSLLRRSFHPDLLRDALERDRFFDRLWIAAQSEPRYARVLGAERADLLRGDIPRFTARVSSRDLSDSRGEVIPDFLQAGSLESVCARLRQLGPRDLELQTWFIRASFATLALGKARHTWKGSHLVPSDTPATPALLLASARAAGDRLGELAVWDGDAAGWVGLNIASDLEWKLAPAGIDLYGGASGIGLFLAHLGAITGEGAYTALARAALQTVRRQLARYLRHKGGQSPGAFDGLGSPIYLLSHLAALWGEPSLLDEAEGLAAHLPALIERDGMFDLIGGSAGAVLSLLSLHKARPSPSTLAVAAQAGDHLVRHARPMPRGVGWDTPIPSAGPITGLAHGAAGIGMSLLALAGAGGQERFRQAGLDALAYERSVFSEKNQNWPSLRTARPDADGYDPEAPENYLSTWCYGAPGVGLSRLACLKVTDDPALRQEIEVAVRTTVREGFGYNHCLCHGDLGNLDFLLEASRTIDSPEAGHHLGRLTARVVDSIGRQGRLTGIPMGIESPELMTGLAGIGYMLLRLAEPDRVPSVLMLEAAGGA